MGKISTTFGFDSAALDVVDVPLWSISEILMPQAFSTVAGARS